MRCGAAHTLQLAIMDALGITEFDLLFRLARAVCKQLRKESNINELKEMKIKCKVPRIECDTRWNSIYLMVNKYSFYNRSSVQWKIVSNSARMFSPLINSHWIWLHVVRKPSRTLPQRKTHPNVMNCSCINCQLQSRFCVLLIYHMRQQSLYNTPRIHYLTFMALGWKWKEAWIS